jgi:hypothetical protein
LIIYIWSVLLWRRFFNGWEMVLHSILGGGQANNKVALVEEEAVGGLSIVFFDIGDRLLPA